MRVLAHIHTFNDADIIDRTIEEVRRQTRPVDGILVVDNASVDGTLEQPSLKYASVVRHEENLGTSGAVISGLRFALEHGYDWIWVFDADSAPEPDALEKLLALYAGWTARRQEETAFLACAHYNIEDGIRQPAGVFTPKGFARAGPEGAERYYLCHVNIWSGCLYRLAAVRRFGLPNPDYVLDWGEGEYGYRMMRAGFEGYVSLDAVLRHNVRGYMSFRPVELKLGPAKLNIRETKPIRCYYFCRNRVYFVLYELAEWRFKQIFFTAVSVGYLTVGFLLQPLARGRQILACLRGIWHGLTGNIAARY